MLNRAWLDAGRQVSYVQNVTDFDDPLRERATATGEDWQALAERETARFAEDMTALAVLPPQAYVGAVEAVPVIAEAVERLLEAGHAYLVDTADAVAGDARDVYFDVTSDPRFGAV